MHLKHLYYGDGKGKTTSALGLAVRAAGNGMNVHIVQFLKGGNTGELNTLTNVNSIKISRCDRHYGFTFKMSENDKKEITDCHNKNLEYAIKLMNGGKTDVLILDEIIDAYNLNLIDKKRVSELVFEMQLDAELIMTGHNPQQKFIDAVDYASEIKAIKHPYEKGIPSRIGIEY